MYTQTVKASSVGEVTQEQLVKFQYCADPVNTPGQWGLPGSPFPGWVRFERVYEDAG